MAQSPASEAKSLTASEKFPIFYWAQKFITIFWRAQQWSLSWARWIRPHFQPCFFKINVNIILQSTGAMKA